MSLPEVVFVYMREAGDQWPRTCILHDPSLESIGGVPFLAGNLLTSTDKHWAAGRRCHLPVGNAVAILEWGSLESYRQHRSTPPPSGDQPGSPSSPS